MKHLLTLLILIGVALGQAPKQSTKIAAQDRPEDPPQFKRRYTTQLVSKAGISLSLDCEDHYIGGSYYGRECVATLRQEDEKEVHFYVSGVLRESVADKILDPVIVPETQKIVAEMLTADALYKASYPQSFKTTDGATWVMPGPKGGK